MDGGKQNSFSRREFHIVPTTPQGPPKKKETYAEKISSIQFNSTDHERNFDQFGDDGDDDDRG